MLPLIEGHKGDLAILPASPHPAYTRCAVRSFIQSAEEASRSLVLYDEINHIVFTTSRLISPVLLLAQAMELGLKDRLVGNWRSTPIVQKAFFTMEDELMKNGFGMIRYAFQCVNDEFQPLEYSTALLALNQATNIAARLVWNADWLSNEEKRLVLQQLANTHWLSVLTKEMTHKLDLVRQMKRKILESEILRLKIEIKTIEHEIVALSVVDGGLSITESNRGSNNRLVPPPDSLSYENYLAAAEKNLMLREQLERLKRECEKIKW